MPMLPFRQQALPLGASHAHAALLFAENFWHQHFDVSSENAFCAWVAATGCVVASPGPSLGRWRVGALTVRPDRLRRLATILLPN